jgi:hypothetical protein
LTENLLITLFFRISSVYIVIVYKLTMVTSQASNHQCFKLARTLEKDVLVIHMAIWPIPYQTLHISTRPSSIFLKISIVRFDFNSLLDRSSEPISILTIFPKKTQILYFSQKVTDKKNYKVTNFSDFHDVCILYFI